MGYEEQHNTAGQAKGLPTKFAAFQAILVD